MRIGIFSDTHGRAEMTRLAIDALRDAGAAYFIHCGDVGSETVLDEMAGLDAAFVFGNNDYDHDHLARYAQRLNLNCLGLHGTLELGGKWIAVIHGDDHRLKARLLGEQRCDYLLQGHTHQRADQREGKIRLINPGALCRARVKSVAVLDLEGDDLQFFEIADPGH